MWPAKSEGIDLQRFDYIIFGSGAAGSTAAYFLAKSGHTVALIDIATIRRDDDHNRHFPPYVRKCSPHYTPAHSNVFGGNTNLWSGKIYLLTEAEMERWPVMHHELLRHSEMLAAALNINHDGVHQISPIDDNAFLHRSTRSNLSNLFECFNLEFHEEIVCFEKSQLVRFEFCQQSKAVTRAYIDQNGQSLCLGVSKGVILACGGLGNIPMLNEVVNQCPWLENSTRTFPLVDHPHYTVGRLRVSGGRRAALMKGYLRGRDSAVPEDCLVVSRPDRMLAIQIDGRPSAWHRVRNLTYGKKHPFVLGCLMAVQFLVYLAEMPLQLIRILVSRFLGTPRYLYSLALFMNQTNLSESTVSLVSGSDREIGPLSIDVNYQFEEVDVPGVQESADLYLGGAVTKLRRRRLTPAYSYTGLHPSCSTPMQSRPHDTQIDSDLAVRGLSNCFVVGSNVFPTNGVTNPTWTIMVLAHRLALHLSVTDVLPQNRARTSADSTENRDGE